MFIQSSRQIWAIQCPPIESGLALGLAWTTECGGRPFWSSQTQALTSHSWNPATMTWNPTQHEDITQQNQLAPADRPSLAPGWCQCRVKEQSWGVQPSQLPDNCSPRYYHVLS